jgi:hypothetical protein
MYRLSKITNRSAQAGHRCLLVSQSDTVRRSRDKILQTSAKEKPASIRANWNSEAKQYLFRLYFFIAGIDFVQGS